MRILVVEDELKMASLLRRGLVEEGHAVDVARTGDDALWMAGAAEYDAIVLDVMLPGVDGFEVCRRLRERRVWAPVLMLTARDAVDDRVAGLDAGADDYLHEAVLVRRAPRPAARARPPRRGRAARRCSRSATCGSTRRRARSGAARPRSSSRPRSSRCSRRSCAARARCSRATQLLEHAWDYGYENRSNVVDVYVRYLREKIDRPFGRDSIETVRGVGYRLRGNDGGSKPAPDPRCG